MITPSIQPGFLLEESTVRFTFDPTNIRDYAYTVGNIGPSISEYIAYDTLNPPNPFIAVTQDGRGKVVYDGGFPKFYNNVGGVGTTFANSSANIKYLINAVNWVANPNKAKRMLVLGDCAATTDSYSVKSTASNGFRTTMTGVANLTGYAVTFKNVADWGTSIDIRLAELEQYALVIFMGVNGANVVRITNQAVNDFVTYRENGNGIIMITDHGSVLTDISQAANSTLGGFFTNVNRVAARFGAYFTGDYNRTPVNVGFIRTTYGDHPLYANLANTESIPAGGSESRVVVPPNPTLYPPSTPLNVFLPRGTQTVNIFMRMNDGSLQTVKYTYIVQGDEIVEVRSTNASGVVETNTSLHRKVNGEARPFTIWVDASQFGTITGVLKKNNNIVGGLYATASSTNAPLYAGSSFRANPGDTFTVEIRSPLGYTKSVKVAGSTVDVTSNSAANLIKSSLAATGASTLDAAITAVTPTNATVANPVSFADKLSAIVRTVNGPSTNVPGPSFPASLLFTSEAAIMATSVTVSDIGRVFVNIANNSAYAVIGGSITKLDTPLNEIFPAPCRIGDYNLSATGVLSK